MKRLIGLGLILLGAPLLFAGDPDPNDPKNWTPIPLRRNPKPPEFGDIDTWLNSEPLTMADLKGKVVVVHFMAFG